MKTSTTNLIAMLTIVAIALAAGNASAGGFSFGGGGKGGGGGNGGGGFKISFGSGNHNDHHNHMHHDDKHHQFYHHKYYSYPVKRYYQPTYVVYDQCYEPYYSTCYVHPGDTWYTISQRCYGQSQMWKHIASYNNLVASNSALVPGQQLQLPVINTDGSLGASSAPAGAPFVPQNGLGGPQAQPVIPQGPSPNIPPTAPAANIRPVSAEPKRPNVTLGSTLMLDGESLGNDTGSVRLRIGGLAMPIEVLDWSNDAVKIQMPTLDLSESINADLEVLRSDGSLASTTAIELTPAASRLALGN